jgi:hypothetical protein
MAVSFIFLILIALFALGVITAFIALIVLAIAKGRGSLVAGALAFLSLLIGAGMLLMFVGWSSVRTQNPAIESLDHVNVGPMQWEHSEPLPTPVTLTTDHTTWAIAGKTVLFAGIGIAFLLAYATRHGHAHAVAAGHHRVWPIVLGLVVLGVFLLGGIRFRSTAHQSADALRTRAVEQLNRIKLQQQEQRNKITERVASIGAKAQTSEGDIHAMMDNFDAPRIALAAPLSPSTSSAELIAVATAPTSDAKTGDEKSRSTPKQRRSAKATTSAAERTHDGDSNAVAEVPLPIPAKNAADSDKTADAGSLNAANNVRPSWVDSTPIYKSNLRREVIVTEEYESTDECYRAAEVYLMFKTYERLQQLIGRPLITRDLPSITFRNNTMVADDGKTIFDVVNVAGGWSDSRLSTLSSMGISPEFLRSEIIVKDPASDELHEYVETSTRSFGPMKRLHTQIEFTPEIDHELMRRWDAQVREDRFAYVGLGAGSVLGLLGMVWGLLKLDTATKGYYSKWLFIGVPAAIMGAMVLSLFAFIA